MSEFILDYGTPDAALRFGKLDSFTQGYIEAMFFTDAGTGDDGDLQDATVADLSPCALDAIIADCAAFQRDASRKLRIAYERCDYAEEQAGRDLWYTRNGHGVGFWCRDELTDFEIKGRSFDLGRILSDMCGWRTSHNGRSIYRGDDGRIYYGQG